MSSEGCRCGNQCGCTVPVDRWLILGQDTDGRCKMSSNRHDMNVENAKAFYQTTRETRKTRVSRKRVLGAVLRSKCQRLVLKFRPFKPGSHRTIRSGAGQIDNVQ